jgi:YggT family protein
MDAVLYVFTTGLSFFIDVLLFLMLLRAILSWFPMEIDHPLISFLYAVTEAVITPVRAIVERSEAAASLPIDLSFGITSLLLIMVKMIFLG